MIVDLRTSGFSFGDDYEEDFTLVKNPRCRKGRSSHTQVPEEPEYLLLLTQTRIDAHGQKQKVNIPLIPPPNGEKFGGGYHVERNPITGGYRLVEPAKGSFSIRLHLHI